MDLNKLLIFQIVSELQSISKAAKKLYRTQSAVSQQILLLEEELGFRLFVRKRARIFLSPEGKILAEVLTKDFDHIRSTIHSIKDNLEMVDGLLRIGILLDYSTPFSISEALVKFSRDYPKVEFKISFGTNTEIEQQLIQGKIDLGILIVFKERDLFKRREIMQASHSLVTSASHYRKMKSKNIEQILENENLIDFTEDFLCITPWINKNFPQHLGILKSRGPSMIVPNHLEALKMIEKGWGTAVLPDYLCENHFKSESLVKVFPKKKELTVGLDIAHFANRTPTLREKLFMDLVVE